MQLRYDFLCIRSREPLGCQFRHQLIMRGLTTREPVDQSLCGGVQFEEMTLPAASKDRAFLTASQPADFMKKASVNSVKLIRTIVPDIARAWQRRSPARV